MEGWGGLWGTEMEGVCAVARMAPVKGGSLTFGQRRTRVAQAAWNGAPQQLTEQQMGSSPRSSLGLGGLEGTLSHTSLSPGLHFCLTEAQQHPLQ